MWFILKREKFDAGHHYLESSDYIDNERVHAGHCPLCSPDLQENQQGLIRNLINNFSLSEPRHLHSRTIGDHYTQYAVSEFNLD
jgi:hypothetical protein